MAGRYSKPAPGLRYRGKLELLRPWILSWLVLVGISESNEYKPKSCQGKEPECEVLREMGIDTASKVKLRKNQREMSYTTVLVFSSSLMW